MLRFLRKNGAKTGQKKDGFCPFKKGKNIDDIAKGKTESKYLKLKNGRFDMKIVDKIIIRSTIENKV